MLTIERGFSGRRRRRPTLRITLPRVRPDLLAVAGMATLVGLGLLNLAALGERSLVVHQLAVVAAGIVLFLLLRRFGSAGLRWLGWACYGSSIVLLLAVEVAGTSAYGARRWLAFGSFTLQPSELAKLGLLLVLAQVLTRDRPWYRRLPVALTLAAAPIALVVTEPDLSTAAVLAAITVAMLVLGRIPLKVIVGLAGVAAVVAPLAEHLMRPYQLERLHAFLSGSSSASGPGWAILQAHIALAWGGLTGNAHQPMHGLLVQYLPDRETDLAFASLVQQWGILAGGLAVLAAAALVWRVARASREAGTPEGGLAAAGFAAMIGVEVGLSVAANLGLVPTAGVPFPLLSYGGTAAAVHIATLGLVLGMRAEAARRQLWLAPAWTRVKPRLVRVSAAGVTCALVTMIGFAWHLQGSQGAQLRQTSLAQMMRCVSVPAPRGEITDRHGVPLAVDVPRDQVWVVPALVSQRTLVRLAALTGRPLVDLRRLVSRHPTSLTLDVATLPPIAARRVRAALLPAVLVVASPRRRYPYGSLLGTILGWTGVATAADVERWPGLPSGAVVGRSGLEEQYDTILRGVAGRQCVYVDPAGTPMRMGPHTAPVPGDTLRTSLDIGLQRRLTANLARVLKGVPGQPRGNLGGAVVLDPQNGQVLAMASLPSYDDNDYGPPVNEKALAHLADRTGLPTLNHVTQVVAPPGSTFKLVVASADMRAGVFPPGRVIPTGGSWTLGEHTFHNWMVLPPQNLMQALAWSNDVYFYQLAWAMGPDPIIATARAMGVGSRTGIDLPGESSGYLGTPRSVVQAGETWYPGSTVILGIGQGYLDVTPLQDAQWTSEVATGSAATPHFGLGYVLPDREYASLSWRAPRRLPFAGKLGPVRAGMALAATSGTASILNELPVRAGGKTGSAQDPSPGDESALDSWFTAEAPLRDPAIVATAFVRGGGEGVTTSGQVALPAMQWFFAHEKSILRVGPAPSR